MGKSFKILATADIHMSNKLPYARPTNDDRTDRLDDQLCLWDHIHEAAEEHDVDLVAILGDLFDKSLVDAVTLTHTTEKLMASKRDTILLPGNHDANSIRGGRFTIEAFGKMGQKRFTVLDKVTDLEFGWLKFWAVPFMPIGDTRAALENFRGSLWSLDPEQVNVLLLHNSILGAEHMGWKCDDGLEPDEVCKGFDWVLTGHFHTHQEFGPDDIGMYLGAPMQHHYADVGREAGFWIIQFNQDGTREDIFIETKLPRFHKFTSIGKTGDVAKGDYVRYEIEATHPEWARLKTKANAVCDELEAKGIHADYKHKPVYHHEARLTPQTEAAQLTLDAAVNKYVEMTGVVTTGLDHERLKQIGKEALEAIRSTRGFDQS